MMKKKVYPNIQLTCNLQDSNEPQAECLHGVLSPCEGGFRFEEAAKCSRHRRNPKLFSGNYCSVVHMANGRYQIHMRTIDATGITSPGDFAFKVYSEILDAINYIH